MTRIVIDIHWSWWYLAAAAAIPFFGGLGRGVARGMREDRREARRQKQETPVPPGAWTPRS